MKTFEEFMLNEKMAQEKLTKTVKFHETGLWPRHDSYASTKGYKMFLGEIAIDVSKPMEVYAIDAFDKKEVPKNLKPGEVIVRYVSHSTKSGGVMPYLKLNVYKGLVYHLTQESFDEGESVEFETRGIKAKYMAFRQSKEVMDLLGVW
jgi:hypothetical protein